MLISEIFYSVQGEGELTGVPSVFVRTSGCNLRCQWCDTPYASWNPEGVDMSVPEILEEIQKHPAKHCVLTGGEPMIAKDIHTLAAGIRCLGWHITIETAGTVPPRGIDCDLASLSPKLSNSTPSLDTAGAAWQARHESTRINPEAIRSWLDGYNFQLKFVIATPSDLGEIEETVARAGIAVPPWKVLLMPEGTDPATLASRREEVLAICREKGYRYCDRLHIHLFGNTKGT